TACEDFYFEALWQRQFSTFGFIDEAWKIVCRRRCERLRQIREVDPVDPTGRIVLPVGLPDRRRCGWRRRKSATATGSETARRRFFKCAFAQGLEIGDDIGPVVSLGYRYDH